MKKDRASASVRPTGVPRGSYFIRLWLLLLALLCIAPGLELSIVCLTPGLAGILEVNCRYFPSVVDTLLMPIFGILPNWPLLLAPVIFPRWRTDPENEKIAMSTLVGAACALSYPTAIISGVSVDDLLSGRMDSGIGTAMVESISIFLAPIVAAGGALVGFLLAPPWR